jgi:hypothetical protein
MAAYVDDAIWGWCGLKWCHLLADSTDELHRFAALLGIKRISFQGPPKTATPHYDLTAFERARAIALGAVMCDREQIVVVRRRMHPRRSAAGATGRVRTSGSFPA